MGDPTLFDYADEEHITFELRGPIFHPYKPGVVIGYIAIKNPDPDYPRDQQLGKCALFPRDHDEHYFRKYDGYGLSTATLQHIQYEGARLIHIMEKGDDDGARCIEFDVATFGDAPLIAYSPDRDTIVEGEAAVRASPASFHDAQRVPAIEAARRVIPAAEVEIDR